MSEVYKKTILLVEDEIIISMAGSQAIKRFGYNVVVANSGEDAVRMATEMGEINLILMDIDLGSGIDGTEAAKQILAKRNLPIIFHTSHSEREMVERVHNITRYGYTIKNSGDFVLQSSIEMAFDLFEAHQKTKENEESLSITLHSIGDAVIAVDINGNITRMNKVAESLTGYTFAEVHNIPLGNVFKIVNADTRSVLENPAQQVLEKGETIGPTNHTILISKEGKEYQIADSAAPIRDNDGNVRGVILVFSDITEKYKMEQELKKSLERYNRIVTTVPEVLYDYILHKDGTVQMLFISLKCSEIFEVEADAVVQDVNLVLKMIHPDDFIRFQEENQAASRSGIDFNSEIRIITPSSGKEKWIQLTSRLNKTNHADDPSIWSGFIIDITNHRLAEEKIKTLLQEKDLLLKEVHHRIKNNMMTIKSLLFLQAESLKDPVAVSALNDSGSRIISMIVLYDKLYRSTDYKEVSVLEYLSPLVEEIVNNFPNYKIVKVEKSIEDFILPTPTLFPVGIMINEILTNAMKYAFIGRESGLLNVTAIKNEKHILFSIQDYGIGISESVNTSNGFGLQLVEMLAKQIHGTISIEREKGTKFILEFNLP